LPDEPAVVVTALEGRLARAEQEGDRWELAARVVPLQHHRIPLLLGRLELTDRVEELVGDLVTVRIDDHGLHDALAGEASKLGALEMDGRDDTTVDREGPIFPSVVESSRQPTTGTKGTTKMKTLPVVAVVVLVMLTLGAVAYGVDQHNALSHARDDLTASMSAARIDQVRMQDAQDDLGGSLTHVRSELTKTKAKLLAAEACTRAELQLLDFAVSENWTSYERSLKSARNDCRKAGTAHKSAIHPRLTAASIESSPHGSRNRPGSRRPAASR
jgi:hypothetical protein